MKYDALAGLFVHQMWFALDASDIETLRAAHASL